MGLSLAWCPSKHCIFVTPNLNQFHHLEMGTLIPGRPSYLSKITQLWMWEWELSRIWVPSPPTQPISPPCCHESLGSKKKAPAWLFPFCFWFSHPEEEGSNGSKYGRWSDGQIRNQCVDTVRGEKSMSLLQKRKPNQWYWILLSPATIEKAINWKSSSKMIYHHKGNRKKGKAISLGEPQCAV